MMKFLLVKRKRKLCGENIKQKTDVCGQMKDTAEMGRRTFLIVFLFQRKKFVSGLGDIL